MASAQTFHYTFGEEIANTITHGVGALLAIAGIGILTACAASAQSGAAAMTAVSIYGASMFLLFTTSALYHAVTHARVKRVLQIMDHSMIYVLIAGTYTPFCLIPLAQENGLAILIAEWTMAIAGIALQRWLIARSDWLNCLIYLVMGWLITVDVTGVVAHSTPLALWLLVAGGVTYSLGIVFYVWERLPYGHAIWHVFVLAGCILQFFSVLQYVL